jgi:hypothetical protein
MLALCVQQECIVSDFETVMPFKAAHLINFVLGIAQRFLSIVFTIN